MHAVALVCTHERKKYIILPLQPPRRALRGGFGRMLIMKIRKMERGDGEKTLRLFYETVRAVCAAV